MKRPATPLLWSRVALRLGILPADQSPTGLGHETRRTAPVGIGESFEQALGEGQPRLLGRRREPGTAKGSPAHYGPEFELLGPGTTNPGFTRPRAPVQKRCCRLPITEASPPPMKENSQLGRFYL